MARLEWDKVGERFYETGIKNCVLYVYDNEQDKYGNGVAWNGISSISESPSGAEANAVYADDTKYLNLYSVEELGATVEAYTYPDEFAECDGSAAVVAGLMLGQQARKTFALCYRTKIGTDTDDEKGYKLHIIYGCKASPSEKQYQTINDSPEAISFSWELTTTPISVKIGDKEYKPTSTVVIDSVKVNSESKMKALEDKLYGDSSDAATLLMPSEIEAILSGSQT